jgi:phospholipase/carboxylesterase
MNPADLVRIVRPARLAPAPGERAPLLLVFHGVGSNERNMAMVAASFDPRFTTVLVRSPITLGPSSYAWFHVQFTPQGPVINATEARDAWTTIAALIDALVEELDADPTRVYLAGFSQGGIVSLATTLTAPEKVAGAVCMSGRLLPEVLPYAVVNERLQGKPVLWVHGRQDAVLGVQLARDGRPELERRGLAVSYAEFDMGHEVSRESLDTVCQWLTAQLDVGATG